MVRGTSEKISIFLLIGLLIFNFFFVLNIGNTVHEKDKQFDKKIAELNSQIKSLQTQQKSGQVNANAGNEEIDFLKEEYSNYTDFANSDRESFFNLINLFFVALGILVTGGIIVLYWIFGQTKAEVKENADLTIRASIDEIELDAKERVKNVIDPKIENFEEKYKEIERFMENQHSLRKSKVLVLCPLNRKAEMEGLELERLRAIVKEAKIMILDSYQDFIQKIENGEVDIIVYRYEKGKENNQEVWIRRYIQALKDRDSKIPVVVYAKPGNLVDGEDGLLVDSYPYAVMANLPTTLTSNMISLSNVLSYERR